MKPDPFPDCFFLACEWEVLKPITHVTQFQGVLWSSLFRHLANPFLAHGETFADLRLGLEPGDSGVPAYATGDRISLGIRVPRSEAARFSQMLAGIEHLGHTHGHFEPGNTANLAAVRCRRTGRPWPGPETRAWCKEDLLPFAEELCGADVIDLWCHAPLRLTKPSGEKHDGRYADATYFREKPTAGALLQGSIGLTGLTLDQTGSFGTWLEIPYGPTTKATALGGFLGRLRFRGKATVEEALALVQASLLGIGKNRAFGFGRFQLTGRDTAMGIRPLEPSGAMRARMLGFPSNGPIAANPQSRAGARTPSDHKNPGGRRILKPGGYEKWKKNWAGKKEVRAKGVYNRW